MTLTTDEQDRRQAALAAARANNATEGLSCFPADDAVLDAWARGEIEDHDVLRMLDANLAEELRHAA